MNKLFFRCKNCLFPSTKPDLHFDEKGVCMACKYVKHYKSIDWKKRKEDFLKLIGGFFNNTELFKLLLSSKNKDFYFLTFNKPSSIIPPEFSMSFYS